MYLRMDFPSGKCYAAQAQEPSLPEWPPHPSRLYSALVAAAYCSTRGMTDQRQAVLKWLETLPPPNISSPAADIQHAPVSYVPPGDSREYKYKKGQKVFEHGVHRWRQDRYFPNAVILGDPSVCYGWDVEPEKELFNAFENVVEGVTHVGSSHSMVTVSAHRGEMPYQSTLVPNERGATFLRVPTPGRSE